MIITYIRVHGSAITGRGDLLNKAKILGGLFNKSDSKVVVITGGWSEILNLGGGAAYYSRRGHVVWSPAAINCTGHVSKMYNLQYPGAEEILLILWCYLAANIRHASSAKTVFFEMFIPLDHFFCTSTHFTHHNSTFTRLALLQIIHRHGKGHGPLMNICIHARRVHASVHSLMACCLLNILLSRYM